MGVCNSKEENKAAMIISEDVAETIKSVKTSKSKLFATDREGNNLIHHLVQNLSNDPTDLRVVEDLFSSVCFPNGDTNNTIGLTAINSKNDLGWTVAHIAAECQSVLNVEIFKLLVKYNCKIDRYNHHGYLPIHYAIYRNHLAIVEYIVYKCKHLIDINKATTDPNRETPLMMSIRLGNVNCVDILCKSKQLNIVTNYNNNNNNNNNNNSYNNNTKETVTAMEYALTANNHHSQWLIIHRLLIALLGRQGIIIKTDLNTFVKENLSNNNKNMSSSSNLRRKNVLLLFCAFLKTILNIARDNNAHQDCINNLKTLIKTSSTVNTNVPFHNAAQIHIQAPSNINDSPDDGERRLTTTVDDDIIGMCQIIAKYNSNNNINDLMKCNENGLSPIDLACQNNNVQFLSRVVYNIWNTHNDHSDDNKNDTEDSDPVDLKALKIAIEYQSVDCLRLICQHLSFDSIINNGYLEGAIKSDNVDVVKILLDAATQSQPSKIEQSFIEKLGKTATEADAQESTQLLKKITQTLEQNTNGNQIALKRLLHVATAAAYPGKKRMDDDMDDDIHYKTDYDSEFEMKTATKIERKDKESEMMVTYNKDDDIGDKRLILVCDKGHEIIKENNNNPNQLTGGHKSKCVLCKQVGNGKNPVYCHGCKRSFCFECAVALSLNDLLYSNDVCQFFEMMEHYQDTPGVIERVKYPQLSVFFCVYQKTCAHFRIYIGCFFLAKI